MSKTTKKINENVERAIKMGKAKEETTVNIIKYNRNIGNLLSELKNGLNMIVSERKKLENHRDISARIKMTERVISSTIKLISQNKLQFFMIDENALLGDNK